MYEQVLLLSVPFRSKNFDAFLAFSVVLGNYTHILYVLLIGLKFPFSLLLKSQIVFMKKFYLKFVFSSTGRDQSSLCDTPLSLCPSVRPSVNNSCYRISSEAIYHRDRMH